MTRMKSRVATSVARRLLMTVAVIALVPIAFAQSSGAPGAIGGKAQQNHSRPRSEVKNIVVVHGAWADGSGWRGVYDILVRDGFNVTVVQEPETAFQNDVTAVKRILALQDGPSILVAHSYGGSVITEAGTDPADDGRWVHFSRPRAVSRFLCTRCAY